MFCNRLLRKTTERYKDSFLGHFMRERTEVQPLTTSIFFFSGNVCISFFSVQSGGCHNQRLKAFMSLVPGGLFCSVHNLLPFKLEIDLFNQMSHALQMIMNIKWEVTIMDVMMMRGVLIIDILMFWLS